MEDKINYDAASRPRLEVDPKQVETWELMVMESPKISDWLLIFPRYLSDGNGLVSPSLPSAPIDELTPAQLKEIKESKAYGILKRIKLPELKAAAQSFAAQAVSGF
jgi:hypothetical protein